MATPSSGLHGLAARRVLACVIGNLLTGASMTASAAELYNKNDFNVRWDNTLTFTSDFRTQSGAGILRNDPNTDDPDRNFRGAGSPAAVRGDIYSELDASYRDFGFRGSAQAWYDTVYDGENDNNSTGTLNSNVSNSRHFSQDTQQLNGHRIELMDAFTYGAFDWGEAQRLSYRAGQHTLLWGQSLYFPNNGIAAGMAPLDAIKAQLLLNPQAKELFRPVAQVSGRYQPALNLSLSAFYQLDWKRSVLPGVGSYFSSTDVLDEGGDKLFAGGGTYFGRGPDLEPSDTTGQFGAAVEFRLADFDLGLYGLQYSDKNPQLLLFPGQGGGALPQIGQYRLAYAEDIQIYGAAASKTIGKTNFGAELSVRANMPLVNTGSTLQSGESYNISNDPPWPVGDTLHAQLSFITALPAVRWLGSDDLNISGEIAGNQLLDITHRGTGLSPQADHLAISATTVIEPNYYGVLPNLDLAPSIGVNWNFLGTSAVLGNQREGTAQLTLGLRATYRQEWKGFLVYQRFMGENGSDPVRSNLLTGRDFVGLSVKRTF